MAEEHSEVLIKNLDNIVEYGRWDDLVGLVDIENKEIQSKVLAIISDQLEKDKVSKTPSLLAKWLPSPNTSSETTKTRARKIYKSLLMSEKNYRKTLSVLRKKIDVLEVKMSSKNWGEIEYSKIPSRAMTIYRNAFRNQDEDRFQEYIESLKKGETKVNASTLYPYDIMERVMSDEYRTFSARKDDLLEEQWKALPNYVKGENNILVMADTSGSMSGRPISTSVGLAIYFAERNKGFYHNKFMTFSSRPSFVELKGDSLADKIRCVPAIIDNTNLEAAFELILSTAIKNQLHQEDLPVSLIVISDMQFDQATTTSRHDTWFGKMRAMFREQGYEVPNVVFWNVADRRDSFQANSEFKGVQLVSGQSAATFKTLSDNIGKTPYEAMLNTLNDERYDLVKI